MVELDLLVVGVALEEVVKHPEGFVVALCFGEGLGAAGEEVFFEGGHLFELLEGALVAVYFLGEL